MSDKGTICEMDKGQLISKRVFGNLNSPKKRTKNLQNFALTTKGQLISKGLFGNLNSPKK